MGQWPPGTPDTTSVKAFGATGNGVTDDTTAIAAAIASLGAAGGVVYFPPGTYLNTGIRLPSRVELLGAGWATSLKAAPNIAADMIQPVDNTVFWIKVRSMRLDGNKANVAATVRSCNFDFTGFGPGDKQVLCDDLYIVNWTGDGFRVGTDCRAGSFNNFYVIGCNGHGMVLAGSDNAYYNVSVGNAGLNGWELVTGCSDSLLSNCRGWQSGQVDAVGAGDGFHFNGCKGVKQSGCASFDNLRHGVNLDACFDVSVECDYDSIHGNCVNFNGGTSDCRVNGTVWNSARATPTFIVAITGLPLRCKTALIVDDAVIAFPTQMVSGQPNGCEVTIGPADGVEIVPFAAGITPDPYKGYYKRVGALTANTTINNPPRKHEGQRLTFEFVQDGVGGRTITFGANFAVTTFAPSTAPNARSSITFQCQNTGTFVQIGAAT